jgi:hypothetical protein
MKILSLLLALLITGTLNAQIKTGGGSIADIEAAIVDLTVKLKENDYKCSTQVGPRLTQDKNIVESYWKLLLLKNLDPKSEACDEANQYLACVNDKSVRKIARKLKELTKDSKHLATKYKIPQSDVDKMLIFFSTLGEKSGEEKMSDGDEL